MGTGLTYDNAGVDTIGTVRFDNGSGLDWGGQTPINFTMPDMTINTNSSGLSTNDQNSLNNLFNSTWTYTNDTGSGVQTTTPEPTQEPVDQGPSMQDLLDAIDDQFSGTWDVLDDRLNNLGNVESGMLSNIGSQETAQRGLVNNAQAENEQMITGRENEARENKQQTFRELVEDFNNTLRSGNAKLGAIGASNSSASEMMKYALSKGQNKRSADLSRQLTGILGKLGDARMTVRREAQNKMLQIDQWVATEKNKVNQYITGLRDELLSMRGSIEDARSAERLETLKDNYESAKNRLAEMQDQYASMKLSVAQNYAQQQGVLAEYLNALKRQGGDVPTGTSVEGFGKIGSFDSTRRFFPGYADDSEDNLEG